jgi:hypothetical protein
MLNFGREPEGQKSLGKHECGWEVNCKINFVRSRVGGFMLDSSGCWVDRVADFCDCRSRPRESMNGGVGLYLTTCFSRRTLRLSW